MSDHNPLVSIMTPVYNGEAYLRECIESVMAQTYTNWDYVIVNNCSTDETLAIAQEYADRDSRIRIHNNEAFARIIANHNIAFRQILPESKYCKPLAADDALLPECVERMVRLAEEHPNVAIVGAYAVSDPGLTSHGPPYPGTVMSGRDLCRDRLLGGPDVFGSPTSVLFRSDLVRCRHAFYNESNLHADSEACLEFLQEHDFGFVHQILTFQRLRQDASMMSYSRKFQTYLSQLLYEVVEYGPRLLSEEELTQRIRDRLRRYYRYLGEQVFMHRGRDFWDLHRKKLAELGYPLSTRRLTLAVLSYLVGLMSDPADTLHRVARRLGRRVRASLGRGGPNWLRSATIGSKSPRG